MVFADGRGVEDLETTEVSDGASLVVVHEIPPLPVRGWPYQGTDEEPDGST